MKPLSPLVACLKEIRVARHLTVTAAAKAAGLSAQTVKAWETGANDPTLRALTLYLESLELRLTVSQPEMAAEPDAGVEPEPELDPEPDVGEQIPYEDPLIAPGEKLCRGCGQIRAHRHFYKDRSRKDGHAHRCKHCWRDKRDERLRKAAERAVAAAELERERVRDVDALLREELLPAVEERVAGVVFCPPITPALAAENRRRLDDAFEVRDGRAPRRGAA